MGIYDYVKELIDERKIEVNVVEKACGFGNGTISKWNKSTPKISNLYAVSQFFSVPLEYFLTGNREPLVYDEMENELLKAYRGSNAMGKARIIQVCMNEYDQSTIAQAI